jgi:hypothetical protein
MNNLSTISQQFPRDMEKRLKIFQIYRLFMYATNLHWLEQIMEKNNGTYVNKTQHLQQCENNLQHEANATSIHNHWTCWQSI